MEDPQTPMMSMLYLIHSVALSAFDPSLELVHGELDHNPETTFIRNNSQENKWDVGNYSLRRVFFAPVSAALGPTGCRSAA